MDRTGYQCDEIPPGVLRFLELPLPTNGASLRATFRRIEMGGCIHVTRAAKKTDSIANSRGEPIETAIAEK